MIKLMELLPTTSEAQMFSDMSGEERVDMVLELFRRSRVKLSDTREDLPQGPPGVFDFNAWNVNKPGTTFFLPVTSITVEYINLLFIYVAPKYGINIVDEFRGGRSAGMEDLIKKGIIKEEVKMTLTELESRVLSMLVVEHAFICQNMNLALQALGLGGWTFSGFIPRFFFGGSPQHNKGLGFRYVTPEKSLIGTPTPIPVGKDGLFEGFCPPYYRDMNEAVEAYVDYKLRALEKEAPLLPFKDPDTVVSEVPEPSKDKIQAVKNICTYIYENYGRFPAFLDPMYMRLAVQAHHLDIEFYDKYYSSKAYTEMHKNHFRLWHPDIRNPFGD